ncbi:DHH family phosphoesterase [Olivibacter sp. SDN3]|uniref:DHH family phosphoesterase n=1 Tax=Olivibacter sp. SDN3 TaxID=2764720 RepID=UPI001651AD3D|nr:DHH family phosphoesterase [Olivibacter sp. SDN3]QNL50996.1 DHH family phosphoesterase [Olivibacter sp. SDN3]
MLTITTLKQIILAEPKKIVITTHYKPDGDALGSSLAMLLWLRAKGHEVSLIVPSDYPAFLSWMPLQEEAIIYTENKERSDNLIAVADLIFCLDFNGLARTNEMQGVLAQTTGLKIMIDHHLEPENFDDFRHWNTNAAATALLVYDFIVNLIDDRAGITPAIATCIYTGIMTDTGSFRFQSTTAEVHLVVADLITLGAKNAEIHEHIYNSASENKLKFLGFCLLNRLVVLHEYNTAYFAITKEDLTRFNIITGDTEGLVNYALSISGIRLAALLIDRTTQIKLSLRSTGNFPANEICSKYFNGGGHRNAAGGHADLPLEEVVAKFLAVLPLYKSQLTK